MIKLNIIGSFYYEYIYLAKPKSGVPDLSTTIM